MTDTPPPQLHEPASASDETVATSHGRRVPAAPHTLRELRLAAGMTLRELADRASISKGSLSQIERGKRVASQPEILSIDIALGLPAGSLQTRLMLVYEEPK